MLSQPTKSKLDEDNYRSIAKKYANLSAQEADWKRLSISALEDMILLAKKLPNDVQKEMFRHDNIRSFVQAILKGNEKGLYSYTKSTNKAEFTGENKEHDDEFDKRVTQIAACLVTEGIKICVQHYKKYHEPNSLLNEPLIKSLNDVVDRCNAMAFKLTWHGYRVELAKPTYSIEDQQE
jgi:hypothetical protein